MLYEGITLEPRRQGDHQAAGPGHPAALPHVLTVGGVNDAAAVAAFSGRGLQDLLVGLPARAIEPRAQPGRVRGGRGQRGERLAA